MTGEDLKKRCLALTSLAEDGGQWIEAHSALVGNPEPLLKRLRRSGRRLRNYAGAAGRKAGVAVFGPSQAGKSTLISSLCQGPGGFLNAVFSGVSLDFLREVNPEGGNETTGLVTRFSLESAPPSPDPAGHPVCLRLFNEMDLVKILANTYFAEAEGDSLLDEDEMLRRLEALEARPEGSGRLSLDDLEDLSEYVRNLASKSAYGQLLEQVFWSRAIPLGVRLGAGDRAELFSCLWGGLAPFTEVYRKLCRCLETLGFAETVFCELSALHDPQAQDRGRNKSILHVNQLYGLAGGRESDDQPPVSVVSSGGARASLPRPLLSALVAELYVQVLEKPGPFMDSADVLDFPGYRAREKFKDITEDLKKPENLMTCFLRGKVAYLFERYNERKEVTAMLLCIGDSVQNNPDLPHVIRPWVENAHGRTETERAGKPVTLFLVLTKFDETFMKGAGSTETVTRWENRLEASFLRFFGMHDWPRNWAAGSGGRSQPFNNIFWLQDLAYADAFLKVRVSEDGRHYRSEGVPADRAKLVEEVRAGYLQSGLVKEFIRNPEAAWDAIMSDDDGGVGYLVRNLTPVLTEDLKTNQLSQLAAWEAGELGQLLGAFYFEDDKDKERRKKEAQAVAIIKDLNGQVRPRGAFGLLLDALQFSDADCQAAHSAPLAEEEPPEAPPAAADGEEELDLEVILGLSPGPQPKSAGPEAVFRDDAARRFRRRIENAWQDRLGEVSSNPRLSDYYGLPRESFQGLAGELGQGARRLKLFDRIEEQMRGALSFSGKKTEATVWMLSRLAATEIGSFVDWLGLPPAELNRQARTVDIQGRKVTLFEPPEPPEAGRLPKLPDKAGDYDLPYFNDWVRALMRLMIHNADDQVYNKEANTGLKRILDRLKPLTGGGL